MLFELAFHPEVLRGCWQKLTPGTAWSTRCVTTSSWSLSWRWASGSARLSIGGVISAEAFAKVLQERDAICTRQYVALQKENRVTFCLKASLGIIQGDEGS